MTRMTTIDGGARRQGGSCPVCGSVVVGHRFGAGTSVEWCSRCAWSRIQQPDGIVAREASLAPAAVRPLDDSTT